MLKEIQQRIRVPKKQYNNHRDYKYRNVEDIFAAFKEVQKDIECELVITDELVQIGERYYIKAVTTLTVGGKSYTSTGFAREAMTSKAMDDAQLTGSTSSYARKYALNALFLLDDNKDIDSLDNSARKGNVLWANFYREKIKSGIPKQAILDARKQAGAIAVDKVTPEYIEKVKQILEV